MMIAAWILMCLLAVAAVAFDCERAPVVADPEWEFSIPGESAD